MNVRQILALFCAWLLVYPTAYAQQSAPQPAAPIPQTYTAGRLVTIWNRYNTTLTGEKLEQFKRDDAAVKTPDDVVKLFEKHFPETSKTNMDPSYAEPEMLVPATEPQMGAGNYTFHKKWRTAPAGKEIKNFSEMKKNREKIVEILRQQQYHRDDIAPKSEQLREVSIRWFTLALDFQWPWALGLVRVQEASKVWKSAGGRNGSGTPNVINVTDENSQALFMVLLEVSELFEIAFKCANPNVVETEHSTIRTEVVAPKCETLIASHETVANDTDTVIFTANVAIDIQLSEVVWKLNGRTISGNGRTASVPSKQFNDGNNMVSWTANGRAPNQPKAYPLSCEKGIVKIVPRCTSVSVTSDGKKATATVLFDAAGRKAQRFAFYVGDKLVGNVGKPELTFSLRDFKPGKYTVRVVVRDDKGEIMFECPGDGETNAFTIPEPPPPPPPPTVKMSRLYGCAVDPDFSHAEEGYAIFYGRLIDLKTGQTVYGADQPRVTRLDWVHDRAKKPGRGAKLLHNIVQDLSPDQRDKFPASVVAVSLSEYHQAGDHVVGMKVTFDQDESVHECWVPWDQPGWTTPEKLVTAGVIIGVAGLIACAIAGCFSGGSVAGIKVVPPGIRPTPPPGIRPPTFSNPF